MWQGGLCSPIASRRPLGCALYAVPPFLSLSAGPGPQRRQRHSPCAGLTVCPQAQPSPFFPLLLTAGSPPCGLHFPGLLTPAACWLPLANESRKGWARGEAGISTLSFTGRCISSLAPAYPFPSSPLRWPLPLRSQLLQGQGTLALALCLAAPALVDSAAPGVGAGGGRDFCSC